MGRSNAIHKPDLMRNVVQTRPVVVISLGESSALRCLNGPTDTEPKMRILPPHEIVPGPEAYEELYIVTKPDGSTVWMKAVPPTYQADPTKFLSPEQLRESKFGRALERLKNK